MNRRALFVNALTFARVPLIFGWLGFAVAQEVSVGPDGGELGLSCLACLMMLLSGLTDAWDGALARRWRVVSPLGKMADPLMDKVFYIVAFPTLVWQATHQGGANWHALLLLGLAVLYLLRDTWVTFLRSVGALFGADVAAMKLGKLRTAISFPGAGWIYMYFCFHRLTPAACHEPWLASCVIVEALLLGLTLVSLVTYTRTYLPWLRQSLRG